MLMRFTGKDGDFLWLRFWGFVGSFLLLFVTRVLQEIMNGSAKRMNQGFFFETGHHFNTELCVFKHKQIHDSRMKNPQR